VPEELADEFSLVGPVGRSRERPQALEESPARTLKGAARSEQECRQAAEFVKGGDAPPAWFPGSVSQCR